MTSAKFPVSGGSPSWKNAVANAAALPAAGGSDCEVRTVCDTKALWAWDAGGASWVQISVPFGLTLPLPG